MSALHHLNTAINAWRRRRNYRSEVARLLQTGNHLVKDTGLTVELALREISKPAWRD